jgi:hypothetical protein
LKENSKSNIRASDHDGKIKDGAGRSEKSIDNKAVLKINCSMGVINDNKHLQQQ